MKVTRRRLFGIFVGLCIIILVVCITSESTDNRQSRVVCYAEPFEWASTPFSCSPGTVHILHVAPHEPSQVLLKEVNDEND